MGNFRKMLAAVVLAACAGTAAGQALDMAPVGDVAMPDGRRVYMMPQTTVVVDVTVVCERVVTGPYARFAQKYFGVIAPLADKEVYTLRSATLGCYDPLTAPDPVPGALPPSNTAVYGVTEHAEEFPRVLPDRRSATGSSLENAARDAAQAVFDLRNRRADLVMGDYAETVYGAGLATAVERLDRMENEYLELFFGKRIVTTYTVRYRVVPDERSRAFVVCRFREDSWPRRSILRSGSVRCAPTRRNMPLRTGWIAGWCSIRSSWEAPSCPYTSTAKRPYCLSGNERTAAVGRFPTGNCGAGGTKYRIV